MFVYLINYFYSSINLNKYFIMKKFSNFQDKKLVNKQLKTIKGGDDSVVDEAYNADGTPRTKDGTIVPPRN